MNEISLSMWSEGAVIVSSIIAAIALGISCITLRQVKNNQQFNILNSIINEVHQMDTEIPNLFILKKQNGEKIGRIAFEQHLSKLFSKLDWISFLVNNKQVKNKSIKKYLYPKIKTYYEYTFAQLATEDMKKDTEYKDFKKLYEKIKDEF
jgi:hypothetical protein